MQEMTGDYLPAERVHHSMVFERARVGEIVRDVADEQAAKKSAEPEAAPFEEVVPVAEVVPVVAVAPIATVPVAQAKRLGNQERFGDRHHNAITVSCAFLVASIGWCISYLLRLPMGDIVRCTGISAAIGVVVSLPASYLMDALERSGALRVLAFPVTAVTTTTLGLCTAIKGTIYGIGYAFYGAGVGLYYAITNQLMPSASRLYYRKIYDWSSPKNKRNGNAEFGAFMVTGVTHLLGVAISIVTIFCGWGTPLTDKLIFGWWGFYVLNVFYLIGAKAREKKATS